MKLVAGECKREDNHCLYMTPHRHGFACDDECLECHGDEEEIFDVGD